MKLAQMAAAASGVRRPSGKNHARAKLKPANAQGQSHELKRSCHVPEILSEVAVPEMKINNQILLSVLITF